MNRVDAMASKTHISQTVSSKGQVVIPAELRHELGIATGTEVLFERHQDGILLRPVTKQFIKNLRGYFGQGPSLEDIRDREHRKKDRS
jgi:AbrB family looped-hinge helix DNA binding protein